MRNIFKIKIDENRVFGLDILRAIAILFVVIDHGGKLLPENIRKVSDFFVFDGVSIFFVLSGFLIGGILIKILEKERISIHVLLNFWVRRWFRTLPNYFLILILLLFLNYLFTDGFSILKFKKYFVFFQNLTQYHPGFFSEAWSLCVEEWFYLLIPIFIFGAICLFNIKPNKAVLLIALLVIIYITTFRFFRHLQIDVNNGHDWDLLFRKQVFTRLDSIMYGVIGAYIHFYHFNKWCKFKIQFLITGIVLFFFSKHLNPDVNGLFFKVFSFSIVSLATLLLLPFLSVISSGKGFLYKPISYISLISYSMYLLNLSVIQLWILDKIEWNVFSENMYLTSMIKYLMYWVLVIILSILLYKYFEIPMMRLRDKKVAFRFRSSNQFRNTTIVKEIKNEE